MRMMVKFRLLWIFPGNPKVIEIHNGLPAAGSRRLCVFASYSRSSRVEDYVLHNLAALKEAGFEIIFVTTAPHLHASDLVALNKLCLRTLRRRNTGYDFGSWKAGIFSAGIDYRHYEQLLLTNDSYYGPLVPWTEVLANARTDLYGITDSYGIAYHLMSYFVLYNQKVLHSTEFLRYWRGVRMIPTLLKTLIIYAYEVGMSQKFQRAGYSVSAWCPERELFARIPQDQYLFGQTITVHRYWRKLIEQLRCPILKVDTFWRVFSGDSSWKQVLEKTGYDTTLIERHQHNLGRKSG